MYTPTTAGHTAREAPRTVAPNDLSGVAAAAAEWLAQENRSAKRMTANITTTAAVASALAIHPALRAMPRYERLGEFISALWNNHCDDHIIVYPHDTPEIAYLGRKLQASKTLILTGSAGVGTGSSASGTIIVCGFTEQYFGAFSTGTIVCTAPSDKSVLFEGTMITQEQYRNCAPLKEYVDRLVLLATSDSRAAEQEFGSGVKIARRLNQFLHYTRGRA